MGAAFVGIFEGEDDVVGEEFSAVGFADDFVEVYPDEGDRVLLGVYAPEGVFAVQVLDEVFADDLVEFIGPVFVGGVGAHHEVEIDVVFPEEEGVTVEETVFELFLNVFLELVVGLELGSE